MQKKKGLFLLECLISSSLFLLFLASFMLFSGYLFKADKDLYNRSISLEKIIKFIDTGEDDISIIHTKIPLKILISLENNITQEHVILAKKLHSSFHTGSIIY